MVFHEYRYTTATEFGTLVVMAAGNSPEARELHDLRELIDAERASAGAAARSAQYWNSQAESESMTLRGRLGAATESGETLRVTLRSGSVHHGPIVAVGADVVAMETPAGSVALIASGQVASVRSNGRTLVTDEPRLSSETLHDRVAALAAMRAEVRVLLTSGTEESGTLVACGVDVFVVRNRTHELCYVALDAVSEIVVS